MAFQCLVGTPAQEVIAYVRAQLGDPTGVVYTDDHLRGAVQDVVDDISRFIPIDYVVGDLEARTSPLTTVKGQQRYSLAGLTPAPIMITSVGQSGLSDAWDISALNLMPVMVEQIIRGPMMDSPTNRVLQGSYFNELDKWSATYQSNYRVSNSVAGLSIDLFPIPQSDDEPIFVRYLAAQPLIVDGDNNFTVPAIPSIFRPDFRALLMAVMLERAELRAASSSMYRAGLVQRMSDPKMMNGAIDRIKNEAYNHLGANSPVAQVSS